MIGIMLAAVSIWLMAKCFDAQIGYSEAVALICRTSPLGFVAGLQIQSLPMWYCESSPYSL